MQNKIISKKVEKEMIIIKFYNNKNYFKIILFISCCLFANNFALSMLIPFLPIAILLLEESVLTIAIFSSLLFSTIFMDFNSSSNCFFNFGYSASAFTNS